MSNEIEVLLFMNAGLWVIVLIEAFALGRIYRRVTRAERQLRIFSNQQQPPDDGSI